MNGRKIVARSSPVAFSSIFGCVLISPIMDDDVSSCHSLPVSFTVSIEEFMEQFWQVKVNLTLPLIALPKMGSAKPSLVTSIYEYACRQVNFLCLCRFENPRLSVTVPCRTTCCDISVDGAKPLRIRRPVVLLL